MKKVLVLVVALVMLAGITAVCAEDKMGLGYQGILMGDTLGGVSLRGWSDELGFDVAIFEGGLKLENGSEESAEAILLQAGGMFAPEDLAGKYAKFYFGGNLAYAILDAEDFGPSKITAWMIEPLMGFEYTFSELPELGWNCQVGYAYVMAEDDDETVEVTLRGINATVGVHYYF